MCLFENQNDSVTVWLILRQMHVYNSIFVKSNTVAVGINFVDHVGELSFGGVLTQGPHDGAQLLRGDGSIAVLVKEGESLLEPACKMNMLWWRTISIHSNFKFKTHIDANWSNLCEIRRVLIEKFAKIKNFKMYSAICSSVNWSAMIDWFWRYVRQ